MWAFQCSVGAPCDCYRREEVIVSRTNEPEFPRLEEFIFSQARFDIVAVEPVDPSSWLGTTLRGGFGVLLRRIVCVAKRERCATCVLREGCTYSLIFESRRSPGNTGYASLEDIPRPFILDPIQQWPPGPASKHIQFDLTLIGKACRCFAHIVYAFLQLGEQGIGRRRTKYTIESVVQNTPGYPPRHLYASTQTGCIREPETANGSAVASPPLISDLSTVRINLLSPLRIKHGGKFTDSPRFRAFVGSAVRRIAQLQYFHCGVPLRLDFARYLREAERADIADSRLRWVEWSRYSSRQKAEMQMGGIVGHLLYKNVPTKYLPVLRLGQYTHVGKLSTFGFGKYSMEVEKAQ